VIEPVQLARREGYLHRVLVALDQAANVVLGGLPDETISSRCARHRRRWWGRVMCGWLDLVQPGHDVLAREADLGRAESAERAEEYSLEKPQC